jgi:xanthine dehydrogenase accessory factor
VGLDLGHTSHREIAVAVLAQLVQLRAAGELTARPTAATAGGEPAVATDPVCGMTVPADASSRPLVHDGTTYFFCSAGCRGRFEADPQSYLTGDHANQEA